jgi:hypothetical protein
MNLRFWMAAKAIVEVVFGIGFVAMPAYLADLFGMDFNDTGILMARLFGTAFIFGAIVLWLAQNAAQAEKALQAIVIGVILSNTIGFVVSLMASLAGTWNALGWLPVGLYLVFGLVFAYFLFSKPRLS